jgi:hypothetical protein
MTTRRRILLSLAFCWLVCGMGGQRPPVVAQEPPAGEVSETRSAEEWRKQLLAWREEYRQAEAEGDKETAEAIKDKIRAIRDPNAQSALVGLFREERERVEKILHKMQRARDDQADAALKAELHEARHRNLRAVYLEALAGIGGRGVLEMLVRVSVTDNDPSVYRVAAELIRKSENRKDALPLYIRYLRSPGYAEDAAGALRGTGLAERVSMAEDPDPALTKALIDALVRKGTRYQRVYRYREWVHPGRGPGKGIGYTGRWESAFVPHHFPIPNRSVLQTLVDYTGEDFGYDKRAWEQWYQRKVRSTTGNRDYGQKP